MQSTISIITPAFNASRWLPRCIESVLAQTIEEWEMIVVDDGSADSTADIAAQYAERDSRIRLLQQPRKGVSAARNAAVEVANGELITFLDADDYLHPQALELMRESLEASQCDLVWVGVRLTEVRTEEYYIYNKVGIHRQQFTQRAIMQRLFAVDAAPDSFVPHTVWGKMMRRSLLIGLTFDADASFFEDLLFCTELFQRCKDGCWSISADLYYWYQHPNSAIHDLPATDVLEVIRTLEKCYNLVPDDSRWKFEARQLLYSKFAKLLSMPLPPSVRQQAEQMVKANYKLTQTTLVTIIVTVYNVGECLDWCLDSICSQTYANLEIILIDDESTDGSSDLCKEWARRDSRILYVSQKHRGHATARNKGLDIMRGNYVMFVDGDDMLHPQAVAVMLHQAMTTGSDMVVAKARQVYEKPSASRPVAYVDRRMLTPMQVMERIAHREAAAHCVWNRLFRATLFGQLRFEETRSEDMLLITRVAMLMRRGLEVDSELYYWMQRPRSVTNQPLNESHVDTLWSAYQCYKATAGAPRAFRYVELDNLYSLMAAMRRLTAGTHLQHYCLRMCIRLTLLTSFVRLRQMLGKLRYTNMAQIGQ